MRERAERSWGLGENKQVFPAAVQKQLAKSLEERVRKEG